MALLKHFKSGWFRIGGGVGLVVAFIASYLVVMASEEEVEHGELRATQRGTTWPIIEPEKAGVSVQHLEQLADLVGGSGFIAYQGKALFRWGRDHRPMYAASAKKSLISVLNLQAVEKDLLPDVDVPVARVMPELAGLNGGKDAAITWRHLACMTSGYGMSDLPGEKFAYNDFAVKLWYDTLMDRVYGESGTEVLRRQLAEPLGFEDPVTFKAYGEGGPEPKLRISARDLARFGQLLLNRGNYAGQQLLSESHWRLMTESVVPVDVPISDSGIAEMMPEQDSVGGTWNISPIGPGRYTFHLWLNRRGPSGFLMLPDAPEDTMLASGKWGQTALWIIPSLHLVVAWNESHVDDHHLARHNPEANMNLAARLIVNAIPRAEPNASAE